MKSRKSHFPPASTVKKPLPPCNQSLSQKEKKTAYSTKSQQKQVVANRKGVQPSSVTEGQPVYKDYWPSIDYEPLLGSHAHLFDVEAPIHPATQGKSTVSSAGNTHLEDSVVAKYIESLCHTREEQQHLTCDFVEDQEPFSLLSPPSIPSSSTPAKKTEKDVIQRLEDDHEKATFSPVGVSRENRSRSGSRRSISEEFDEAEILHLQERTSRLLERGECYQSEESISVSSEGLGRSDFSSPVNVDEPVRRPLFPSLINRGKEISDSVYAAPFPKSVIPSVVRPTRPEDDILFQWRLRRKMEPARNWYHTLPPQNFHGPTFNWQAPSGKVSEQSQNVQPPEFLQRDTHPHIIPATLAQTSEAHRVSSPAAGPPPLPASANYPQVIGHVPAHMHLLCDVLPCPIQSSHSEVQQGLTQKHNKPDINFVYKRTQVADKSVNTLREVPLDDNLPSTHPTSSVATPKNVSNHQTVPDGCRKKKPKPKESKKTENTSARSSSHQKCPKKVKHWEEGNQELRGESCSRDNEKEPSSLGNAIRQVVSEVLFPMVDPDPPQRIAGSSIPPVCIDSASSPFTDLPCNAQSSMEVISQLLQEAEDSDEKDFEDDPLLQVLYKQRKWIKEQISEVHSLLTGMFEEPEVT